MPNVKLDKFIKKGVFAEIAKFNARQILPLYSIPSRSGKRLYGNTELVIPIGEEVKLMAPHTQQSSH